MNSLENIVKNNHFKQTYIEICLSQNDDVYPIENASIYKMSELGPVIKF